MPEHIKRIAFGVSYDGRAYHGWQSQESELATVQDALEKAFSSVANQPIRIFSAGRTDACVHATGQVGHFDTTTLRTDHAWVFGANANLPQDISVTWAQEVSLGFHARFSALARRYQYVIYNHPIRPALFHHGVTWHRRALDVSRMQAAALHLLGTHDFSSFRGSSCQSRSPIRELQQLTIRRVGEMIILDVQANAFLMHMVRNITGVLLQIGAGLKPPEWAKEVLEARNRAVAGVTALPNGLYLAEVIYPELFELPKADGILFPLG